MTLSDRGSTAYPKAALRFQEGMVRASHGERHLGPDPVANLLAPYISGILNMCRYPLHMGLVEGINNKIKVMKRMAYGYRDDAYFFLKIRAAFPGNP